MHSLDTLNLLPVWVNPDHLASTAKIILAGHRLKVLGVVEGGELVGIVNAARAGQQSDRIHVRDFMEKPARVIEATTSLREVAETFYEEDLDYLPVVDDDRFRGIVTPNMLLKALARSWDPLTGLSWSDSLREWGVQQLKDGREITILFIDLDDFGAYNKKYGHIVGDRVLQEVVRLVQANLDPSLDLLVRYGGDEFAIGSLREQAEALMLSEKLRQQMSSLRVEGSPEPVTFCVGVQGGKRTKERENVHYAATLDNLINLASKNCVAQKERKSAASTAAVSAAPQTPVATVSPEAGESTQTPSSRLEEITPETAADLAEAAPAATAVAAETESEPEVRTAQSSEAAASSTPAQAVVVAEDPAPAVDEPEQPIDGPLQIGEVVADAVDANSVTQVVIQAGSRTFTGICPRKGGSVVKSVALATANAVAQMKPEVKLEIREVNLTESETGVRFISVIGTSTIDGEAHPIGGVGTVGRNLYLTVAEATLQAYTNLETIRENL